MKYTLSLFITILFLNASAQIEESELSIINSGGNYSESGGIELHSSIGEPIIEYANSNDIELQNGFLQNFSDIPEPSSCVSNDNPIDKINTIIVGDGVGLDWQGQLSPSEQFELTVFSRDGNVMYHSEDYSNISPLQKFNGTIDGSPMREGTYLYLLKKEDQVCIKSFLTILGN